MQKAFHFSWLSFLLLVATTFASLSASESLGQESLRERWHSGESETLQKENYFTDIAEDYWLKRPGSIEPTGQSNDVHILSHQIRDRFLRNPFSLRNWVSPLIHWVNVIQDRWWDFISGFSDVDFYLFPPLFVALFLLLTTRLWVWKQALFHDHRGLFRTHGNLILFLLTLTLSVWCLKEGLYLTALFALSCVGITYSRRQGAWAILSLIFGVALFANPFFAAYYKTAEVLTPYEAMAHGRTRLEYSHHALGALPAFEKAKWAYFNGDDVATKHWLGEMPLDWRKEVFELNLQYTGFNHPELIEKFLVLQKRYGDKPIILFNLSRLYSQTQELVKSDELSKSLSEKNDRIFKKRIENFQKTLIPPPALSAGDLFPSIYRDSLSYEISKIGLRPFMALKGSATILWFLSIFLFFVYCLQRRKRASGYCSITGQPTPAPHVDITPFAQIVKDPDQKGPQQMVIRQAFDKATRAFSRLQDSRAKRWTWFFPGVHRLLQDDSLGAFIRVYLFYQLLWLSFPSDWKGGILSFASISPPDLVVQDSFYWLPALLALILYVFLILDARRKAYR